MSDEIPRIDIAVTHIARSLLHERRHGLHTESMRFRVAYDLGDFEFVVQIPDRLKTKSAAITFVKSSVLRFAEGLKEAAERVETYGFENHFPDEAP